MCPAPPHAKPVPGSVPGSVFTCPSAVDDDDDEDDDDEEDEDEAWSAPAPYGVPVPSVGYPGGYCPGGYCGGTEPSGGGAYVSVTYCTCPVSVRMYGWPAGVMYTGCPVVVVAYCTGPVALAGYWKACPAAAA